MIERIVIKDVATFDNSEHVMENLGKLNFIFGSNGSGKTTISRVLKTPEKYTSCSLSWEGNMQIERRVYNSDFVEANFVPEEGMPGIFTLGQEESDTKKKIKDLREQLTKLKEEKKKTEVLLYGEDQAKGKTEELKSFKESCIEKIWQLTQNYRNGAIREGLTGYLKKEKFFTKVLEQYKAKRIKPDEYDELEKKATVIFQGNHEKLEEIPMVNFSSVQRLNNEQILSKKIIGKEDVDIGTLIKKLGNSDWIKDGMKYLDVSEGVCPFCQKTLQDGFYAQIEEYFDETYSADLKKIDTLRNNYQNESNNLVEQINKILQRGSDKINNTELQNTIATLLEIFKLNNKKIEDKIRTPSIPIELEGYQGIPEKVAALITTANKEIEKHNAMVANLADEKEKLKREIWQAIVQEVESEIVEYNREVQEREKEISDLHQQNEKHTRDIQRSKEDLQNLQIKLTSVIPMKDKINQWLEQFGFMGFRLDCGDDEHSYKIIRENGSPAEKTLSEGERNFIAFLYFFALLQGSNDSTGNVPSQIVVIDDPVSSMDSDVLFIISFLIRNLYCDICKDIGNIKQLFLSTHNIYFHKAVSFSDGLKKYISKQMKYWVTRKEDGKSELFAHENNPVQSTYEILWEEIRDASHNPKPVTKSSLQNTMRRILEHYYKYYGGIPLHEIADKMKQEDRGLARSLISWVNDGSHSFLDDVYYTPYQEVSTKKYLNVFRLIFSELGHIAHYNMMMRIKEET
jgi:hypothetical protein